MVMSLMRASSYEVLDLFGLEIKSDNAEEMRRKILDFGVMRGPEKARTWQR